MTPEEAVTQLDVIEYDEDKGFFGPGSMHEAADEILLAVVDPEVAAAYERLIDRCNWWAYS